MVVDTSAIVAILLDEEERDVMVGALLDAEQMVWSAATYLETIIVLTRRGFDARRELEGLVARFPLIMLDVSVEQAELAATAFLQFGKGQGGRAQLNFGDCFAYALAKSTGEPLLFNGDDFTHTDVARVL
jgi:ribonuclease VapC